MSDVLERAVVWRSLAIQGIEYCALWRNSQGWLLKGTTVGMVKEGRPLLARYEVHCDQHWRTQRAEIERTIGANSKRINLEANRGVWRCAGKELPGSSDWVDVDFTATPSTNTLAIRRLNLKVGETGTATAAWVTLPDLAIQPLPQRYTRLAADRYHYESSTGFSTEITVDELGLVISYPGGWERIGAL